MKTSTLAILALLVSPLANAATVAVYDFNSASDLAEWTPNTSSVNGLAVSGGTINGTASGNDPQLRTAPASALTPASGETWSAVEFRVREVQDEVPGGTVAFNPVGLIVGLNVTTFSTGFNAVDSGDGYYTVTLDISSFGSTSISNFRLDPIGGASSNSNSQTAGNTFEVDYIRISDTSIIPEPSAWGLLALGAGLTLLRRRR